MKTLLRNSIVAFILLSMPVFLLGQAPNLGTISSFAVFTKAGAIINTGTSLITGNVGSSNSDPVGFPPGTVYGNVYLAGNPNLTQPSVDLSTANDELSAATCGSTLVLPLGGQTLNAGVYCYATAATLSGTLTLDGQGNPNAVFIIKIGGAFATIGGSSIHLINSASPNNVYWQIGGQFDLVDGSAFAGTIIVNGAINLLGTATLDGRVLSIAGAIGIESNTVTTASYFRSRITGNWDNVNTWELSFNNSDWNTATFIPTSSATAISISSGNLVSIVSNATASALSINPGGQLTLNSDKTLTATTLDIKSNAAGTGTFVDFNTIGGLTISGTTNVEQYLAAGRNWYISSPISAASASTVINSSAASKLIGWNEPTGLWDDPTAETSLVVGKGYGCVAPTSTVTFSGGTLNTGLQTSIPTRHVGVTKEGFNLMGNPYPSYVDLYTALDAGNTTTNTTNIIPTYWYRTKLANNSAYTFDTYNFPGEVGTGNSGKSMTNYISPMQAFWIRVKIGSSTGTLSFNNAIRSHKDVVNNSFRAPAAKNSEQQLLRVQVSDGNYTDEAIIYFNANAANSYDVYDSPKMQSASTSSIPEIYTMAGSEQLVINGMNALTLDTEIPLEFTANQSTATSFTIKATEINNLASDTRVILKDKAMNTETDLTNKTAAYEFSTLAGNSNRFGIIFKSASGTTGLNNLTEEQTVAIYKNRNNQITIDYKDDISTTNSVNVYNSMGQNIVNQQITGRTTVINTILSAGVYVIKVQNTGKDTVKKITIN